MFKNLNGLAQVLKNASSMGERVKEMRESLANETATGAAGGDMIEVEVSGLGEVKKLRIGKARVKVRLIEGV